MILTGTLLVILALLGAPLFAVIAASALIGFHLSGVDLSAVTIELYRLAEMPVLLAIPLFTSAVCGLLAYHGARMVRMDYEAGLTAFAAVPAWACELIIPIGFGVSAVRFLLSSLDHLWRFAGARQ